MKLSSLLFCIPAFGLTAASAQRNVTTASGPVAAPVSIVVYADLECPFSAATLPELEKVAAQHPKDLRFEVRQFPLDQHQHAELAHEAALAAAAQDKYLAMVNLIQANQKLMDRAQFLHYAVLLHLNMPQFTRDLDGHRFAARVQEDLAEGRALGVELTPTMFINGKRVDGAQNAADLNELVERSIAVARGPAAAPDIDKPLSAEDATLLSVKPTAETGAADAPGHDRRVHRLPVPVLPQGGRSATSTAGKLAQCSTAVSQLSAGLPRACRGGSRSRACSRRSGQVLADA